MDNLIGQRLANRYEIQAVIGYGGMGVVYRGYDALLRRTVAVKVLPPQLTIDPVFVQRFQHEAITAANLRHPHIVTIYDVGAQDGVYYIVMEYLEGMTLDQWLIQHGALSPQQASAIVAQVADALDHAHAEGIVHRDIKPSNIMVDSRGHATLMDFGLVRAGEGTGLTRSSLVVGTPEYMAPEQALGQAVDGRTDIYALGAVIYKLLTGAAPFVRSTPLAIAHAHAYEPPAPLRELRPDLPKAVEAVVLKALAKKPADRYQRASALAADFSVAASAKGPAGKRAVPAAVLAKKTPTPPPRSSSPQPQVVPAPAADPAAETRLVARGQTPTSDPQPAPVVAPVTPLPALKTQAQQRRSSTGLLLAAIAALVVIVLAGAVWALSRPGGGSGAPEAAKAAAPAAPAVVMAATETPTQAPTVTPSPAMASRATAARPPSATPTEAPTATRAAATPIATATRQPTATPKPTHTPTARPQLAATSAARPATTVASPTSPQVIPAPQLSEPADGQHFKGPITSIVLRWEPAALPEGACYVVAIRFQHNIETWTDVHCLTTTQLALPAYLADNATDARFEWQVTVMQPRGSTFNSVADGEPLGPPSPARTFVWALPTDAGDDSNTPPTRPAPGPTPTRP
jgi:serine/threonine-protein kinase